MNRRCLTGELYSLGDLFFNPQVQDYVAKGMDIFNRISPDFGAVNYFGLNFVDDRIHNLKIYFGFNESLSYEEANAFLPTLSDFKRYYPLWTPFHFLDPRHSPCSFAIKVTRDLQMTYQFHFRFPYSRDYVAKPERIQLYPQDLNLAQGISYEYTGDKKVEKRYYYTSPHSIATQNLLSEFQHPYVGQLLEYTEMGEQRKIIHWIRSAERVKEFISKTSEGTEYLRTTMAIAEEYKLTPLFPGQYLNQNKKSIYFFRLNEPYDFPFESPKNTKLNTLSWLLGPHNEKASFQTT